MPMLKNARHELFAEALAKGKNASEAYVLAGYKANRGHASTLKQDGNVSKRVNEILEARDRVEVKATERAIERTAITKERVATELAKMGFAQMGDGADAIDLSTLTREQSAALAVKRAALMDLAKLFGYVIDRSEIKRVDEFDGLNAAQLRQRLLDKLTQPPRSIADGPPPLDATKH